MPKKLNQTKKITKNNGDKLSEKELLNLLYPVWQGRQGSNLRQPVLETGALPAELLPYIFSGSLFHYTGIFAINVRYMSKSILQKPTLIMLYGFPGSGKTYVARQLAELVSAAHVQADRIRYQLFQEPRYDKQENGIVMHLMNYMTEEFLNAGVSVVYDTNAMRESQRRELRDLARSSKAQFLLIWLQIDPDAGYVRTIKRDRRKADDRYSRVYDRASFEEYISTMQNPGLTEDYLVVSGKHTFTTQKSAIAKRLYDMNVLGASQVSSGVVKPSLVNLVPNAHAGRVDQSRRNIVIR